MSRPWITVSFTPASDCPVTTTERFVGWLVQHNYADSRPIHSRVVAAVLDPASGEVVPVDAVPGSETGEDKPSKRMTVF